MRIVVYFCLLLLGVAGSCSEKQIYESETIAASAMPSVPATSSGVYKKYTGTYQMQQASFSELVISSENGKLYAQATGEKKVEIFPEKGDMFSVPAFNANITFIEGADSTFSEISVLLNGNELKGVRK